MNFAPMALATARRPTERLTHLVTLALRITTIAVEWSASISRWRLDEETPVVAEPPKPCLEQQVSAEHPMAFAASQPKHWLLDGSCQDPLLPLDPVVVQPIQMQE